MIPLSIWVIGGRGNPAPTPVLMVPDNAGPEIKNFDFYMIQKGVSGRAGHPDVTKYL